MKTTLINRQSLNLGLVALCVLLLGGCIAPMMPTKEATANTRPVKVKAVVLPFISYAPFFIAQEEGYFAEQGLEVEFVRLTGDAAPIPMLLQGELDVSTLQVESGFINAIAGGGMLKAVADKGYLAADQECTAYGLLAKSDLVDAGALAEPAALQGRQFAIEPLTAEGYYIETLLNTTGLTLDDIETTQFPPSALAEAFANGAVDVAHIGEPWITRIVRTGHAALWLPAQEVIPDFQWVMITYGPTLLQENPTAGQHFMVAYLKAVRQYNQGKTARNLEILAKYTELAPDLLQEACWPAIRDSGEITVQSMLDFQAWAAAKGLLDGTITEEQFWDPSFIEYANQVLAAPQK